GLAPATQCSGQLRRRYPGLSSQRFHEKSRWPGHATIPSSASRYRPPAESLATSHRSAVQTWSRDLYRSPFLRREIPRTSPNLHRMPYNSNFFETPADPSTPVRSKFGGGDPEPPRASLVLPFPTSVGFQACMYWRTCNRLFRQRAIQDRNRPWSVMVLRHPAP